MQIRFRFRWIPFVATVLVAALGVSLAQWQARRAEQKQVIEQQLTQRQAAAPVTLDVAQPMADDVLNADLEYRKVVLRGSFMPGWTVYLDNRPYNGVAGFYVVTPFLLAGSDRAVAVERGWVPRNADNRMLVPAVPTPAGTVQIEGTIRSSVGHLLQLGTAAALQPGAILQNLNLGEFARATGLKLQPMVIEQTGADSKDGAAVQAAAAKDGSAGNSPAAADSLVRDWPAPSLGIERHLGYEFQWYALAAMAIIFFVVTGFRRGSK